MRIEVKTITPEVAAVMLENNPANRPVKRFHLDALVRDMKAGRWQVNGDAIRLNCDGSLIDGQHRLNACVIAGVPFETVVISGLPSDVRQTIDSGAKRTHSDRLAMLGVANSKAVSASARMIGAIAANNVVARFSGPELDRILELHPGIHESVSHWKGSFPGMATILPSVHYIGTFLGRADAADRFAGVFKTGIPTYPGDAAHALRERIVKNRGTLTRYTETETLRATVAVWRHFLTSTPVKQIKLGDVAIAGWNKDRLGL